MDGLLFNLLGTIKRCKKKNVELINLYRALTQ